MIYNKQSTTYKHTETAGRQQIILNIKKINPQFITTGNIGCITQITKGTKIPILHTVEIMDWYTGGPKPNILKKL